MNFALKWSEILSMAKEEGRSPKAIGSSLYHNINMNENREAALQESKAFLDKYYTSNFSPGFGEGFTTTGNPKRCIEEIKSYFGAGLNHVTFRMTSWNQKEQFDRFVNEVAPAFR